MKLFSFASKCKGSISLFLCIILLPTLTFTGLMVDSANLALSKSIVENAGELATNAALANYDTVLNDVYGLLSLSQSVNTSADAELYFSNTLNSGGLLNSMTDVLSSLNQNMKDFLGINDKKVNPNKNFLNVSYEDFAAKGVNGSSLRNYKIMKNQIVEFMKYRAPANIVMDIFASTAVFQSADAKMTVTTKKADVDIELVELNQICQRLYSSINSYDSRIPDFKMLRSIITTVLRISIQKWKR